MRAREWSMKRRHILARQCCTEVLLHRAQARRGTDWAGHQAERKHERLSRQGLVLRSQAGPQGNFIQFSSAKGILRKETCAKGKQDRELQGTAVSTWSKQGSTKRDIWCPLHVTRIPGEQANLSQQTTRAQALISQHNQNGLKHKRNPRWVTKAIFNSRLFVPDSSLKW